MTGQVLGSLCLIKCQDGGEITQADAAPIRPSHHSSSIFWSSYFPADAQRLIREILWETGNKEMLSTSFGPGSLNLNFLFLLSSYFRREDGKVRVGYRDSLRIFIPASNPANLGQGNWIGFRAVERERILLAGKGFFTLLLWPLIRGIGPFLLADWMRLVVVLPGFFLA